MIDDDLLEILRCPEDQTPLECADGQLVDRINRAVSAGRLTNVGGRMLEKPLDGGLVRQAGDLLYPVIDNIPIMLRDEAVSLAELPDDI